MIDEKSVLAIVPARGGSKGLPRKNILVLGGKPMIAWTIEAAKKSKYIDRVILSSEDTEIIRVAEAWGCEVPFIRPAELAQDHTPGIETVLHALETLQQIYDYVVLLQPTSPFRSHHDIDGCIESCARCDTFSCVSVVKVSESPYWMYKKKQNNEIIPLIQTDKRTYQRQLLPETYILNGAVYVSRTKIVKSEKKFVTNHTLGYEMPRARSLDIDCKTDFQYAQFILSKKEIS